MENRDNIIGQLMDQGYNFDDIIEAIGGSSDTVEVVNKLEKMQKKAGSRQSEFMTSVEDIDTGLGINKEVGEKQGSKKVGNYYSGDGLETLIEFCKKKSQFVLPNSNLHKDFRSVVYTVEKYKDI